MLIGRWPRRDADRLVALLRRLMADAHALQAGQSAAPS